VRASLGAATSSGLPFTVAVPRGPAIRDIRAAREARALGLFGSQTGSYQLSLHEHPMGLVLIGDLAFRVRPDVLEPAGAVQAVGRGHEVRAVETDPLVARYLRFGN